MSTIVVERGLDYCRAFGVRQVSGFKTRITG